ncbi:hypothetical protein ISS03_04640 [Patescibacteria group bacterium]|nr:hypothetical protein [Patescibacteria group bacterium]
MKLFSGVIDGIVKGIPKLGSDLVVPPDLLQERNYVHGSGSFAQGNPGGTDSSREHLVHWNMLVKALAKEQEAILARYMNTLCKSHLSDYKHILLNVSDLYKVDPRLALVSVRELADVGTEAESQGIDWFNEMHLHSTHLQVSTSAFGVGSMLSNTKSYLSSLVTKRPTSEGLAALLAEYDQMKEEDSLPERANPIGRWSESLETKRKEVEETKWWQVSKWFSQL